MISRRQHQKNPRRDKVKTLHLAVLLPVHQRNFLPPRLPVLLVTTGLTQRRQMMSAKSEASCWALSTWSYTTWMHPWRRFRDQTTAKSDPTSDQYKPRDFFLKVGFGAPNRVKRVDGSLLGVLFRNLLLSRPFWPFRLKVESIASTTTNYRGFVDICMSHYQDFD